MVPLVPITGDYAIDKATITPAATYTDAEIVEGSDRVSWVNPADRRWFRALVSWRQQADDLPPVVRTVQVGFSGRAESGPFEKYDLSSYCTSEAHAIRFGRYLLAQRLYCDHTRQVDLLPSVAPPEVGSVVRIKTERLPVGVGEVMYTYRYRVQELRLTAAGGVSLQLVHFPVTIDGRSQVALDIVNQAEIEAQIPEGWGRLPIEEGEDEGANTGAWIAAVGGTVTRDGSYRVHTLTAASGVLFITSAPAGQELEYLVVGGGASGQAGTNVGTSLFAGGGGGVVAGTLAPTVGAFPYTVGAAGKIERIWIAGGGSGFGEWQIFPGEGGNSTIWDVTAGGGDRFGVSGSPQGNGRGAVFAGGAGAVDDVHGGGGGAGGAGAAATGSAGGQGGPGIENDITGTPRFYGAGGCGGRFFNPAGVSEITPPPRSASAYGGGGTGGKFDAQPGVIIIRYQYKP
jgi:hypothetical protein